MKSSFLLEFKCRPLMQFILKWPRPRIRAIHEQNFPIFCGCDQLLFVSQQPNFIFDAVFPLLSMTHASVKSYRSDLFGFRMNILNSIPVLPEGHLPMSLNSIESLLAILFSVSLRQWEIEDDLTLAIPASHFCPIMILACSLTLLPYQKHYCWPLTYCLLHSKLFLHLMKQNSFRCFFGTTLRRLIHGTLQIHI